MDDTEATVIGAETQNKIAEVPEETIAEGSAVLEPEEDAPPALDLVKVSGRIVRIPQVSRTHTSSSPKRSRR